MLSEQLDGACHDEYVIHVDNQTNACWPQELYCWFQDFGEHSGCWAQAEW